MNIFELKAVKSAIMSFTLNESDAISVHIGMGNMIALSYLMKIGVSKTRSRLRSAKKFGNTF